MYIGFETEFKNMKICSLNNENSVKCYEYFNNEYNFTIIMELCDKNLSKVLAERIKKNGKGFNSEEILGILNQLNNVFKTMKENEIIHRDLKLENILIKYKDKEHKKKYIIKLRDYDSSLRLSSITRYYFYSNKETLMYIASEILKGKEHDYKCDLWSIGIIIYKLYFCKFPYSGKKEIDELNEADKKELDNLIKNLLEKDPSKRLSWNQYFSHPFFEIKYRNKINLINECDYDGYKNIFGKKFVENNKDNIELLINGIKSELIIKYKLKKGKNNIEIIIKNKINKFEYMFYDCYTLKNIEKLRYLDTKKIDNFSHIFSRCSSLSNLKGLQNWNVSNGKDFSDMFSGCSLLSKI